MADPSNPSLSLEAAYQSELHGTVEVTMSIVIRRAMGARIEAGYVSLDRRPRLVLNRRYADDRLVLDLDRESGEILGIEMLSMLGPEECSRAIASLEGSADELRAKHMLQLLASSWQILQNLLDWSPLRERLLAAPDHQVLGELRDRMVDAYTRDMVPPQANWKLVAS